MNENKVPMTDEDRIEYMRHMESKLGLVIPYIGCRDDFNDISDVKYDYVVNNIVDIVDVSCAIHDMVDEHLMTIDEEDICP
eukprot:3618276-Rhodomonas_salina.1